MLINKINLNNNKMPEKAWIRSNVAFLLFFSLSMVAILILFKPTITGFIGADTQNLPVSALVTQNTSYILSAKNSSAPVELNSLMISGKVIGDGDVKVYMLKEDRTKLLVYSNEESGWPSFITGFVKGGNQEKKQEQQEKKEERDEKKEEHQEAVEEKKEEIAEAHEEHQEAVEEKKEEIAEAHEEEEHQEAVEEKKEEIAEAHEEHQEAVEEKKEAKEEKAGEKQEKKEEKTKKREQQKQEEKKIKAEEKQEIKRIKEEQKRIEKEQKDIQKIKQTQFTFMPEQEFEANQEISIQDQINDYISSQEQINSIINSTDEQNISLFRYECYDTCFLTPDNSSTHKFIFDIEPGTILIIDEISYSSYVK